jgi:hypothetical protein
MSTPLAWFGLPEDADERAVKRAYAQRLKAVRPEVDPAGFQQLHDHYRAALNWVEHRSSLPAVPTPVITDDEPPKPAAKPVLRAIESLPPGQQRTPLPPASEQPAMDTPPRGSNTPSPPAQAPHPLPPLHLPSARVPAAPQASQPPMRPAPAVPVPPAATAQFDMDVFVADYLQAAIAGNEKELQAWLEAREDLWSLHLKHQAGRALLQRLFRDPPPIRMSSFDATLVFFGLDHALTGVDPLQIQQLRKLMQERHALVQKHRPAAQRWGANRRRLDVPGFFRWFSELAALGEEEQLCACMHTQPALLSLPAREQAAPSVLDHLFRERPPMPQECTGLLFQFFGLAPLISQRGGQPGEVLAHLHMRWLMLPRQIGKLTMQVKDPKERFGDPQRSARLLRLLQRPFQWWWITLLVLVPKQLFQLGLFAWRLSGGVPPRLDEFVDPRLTRFCIAIADLNHLSWPRVFVGAVRCAALLLACIGIQLWRLHAGSAPGEDAWLPLKVGAGLTACWLYYLAFTAMQLWQGRPEEPVQPRPLLRMAWIPMLVAIGVALALTTTVPVVGEVMLATAAMLAFQRIQRRNPPKGKNNALPGIVILALILGVLYWMVLQSPTAPATVAMLYWLLDLFVQRKQLRFRYRASSGPPPLPAQTG